MCAYQGAKILHTITSQIRAIWGASIADLIALFAHFKKDVLIAKHRKVLLILHLKNIWNFWQTQTWIEVETITLQFFLIHTTVRHYMGDLQVISKFVLIAPKSIWDAIVAPIIQAKT